MIFEYVKEFTGETKAKGEAVTAITNKSEKPTKTNKTYHFKDIESMKKATSMQEAFEGVFGKGRLFNDFKDSNSSFNGEIKYNLSGVYETKNIPFQDWYKYNPEKQYIFDNVSINITMKPGIDTRMEMIDFLHYLKFSELTKPHYIKESLPEDSVKVDFIRNPVGATPEKIPPFTINMYGKFEGVNPSGMK